MIRLQKAAAGARLSQQARAGVADLVTMQPPSLPKPSATYVAAARAAKGGGEPSRPPEETFDSALCITGGGLVPPTELYGVFRGLAHKEALDNFDTIAGASGGYIASMM